MAIYAEVENGFIDTVVLAEPSVMSDPFWLANNPGTWIDITNEDPEPGVGWLYNSGDGSFTQPDPPPPIPRTLLYGPEWVETFTDTEWEWLKVQRSLDPSTTASRQLDKMMDAIRWTNSVDVAAPNMDPFYDWLLNQGLPGGQTRIDELRQGVI